MFSKEIFSNAKKQKGISSIERENVIFALFILEVNTFIIVENVNSSCVMIVSFKGMEKYWWILLISMLAWYVQRSANAKFACQKYH